MSTPTRARIAVCSVIIPEPAARPTLWKDGIKFKQYFNHSINALAPAFNQLITGWVFEAIDGELASTELEAPQQVSLSGFTSLVYTDSGLLSEEVIETAVAYHLGGPSSARFGSVETASTGEAFRIEQILITNGRDAAIVFLKSEPNQLIRLRH